MDATKVQRLIDAAHDLFEAGTAGGWEPDMPLMIGPPEDERLATLVAKDELDELRAALDDLPRRIT